MVPSCHATRATHPFVGRRHCPPAHPPTLGRQGPWGATAAPPGDATREALARCGKHLADTSGTLRAEAVSASTAAGSAAQPRMEIRLVLAGTGFMNVCTRIHDTASALPAVASTATHG